MSDTAFNTVWNDNNDIQKDLSEVTFSVLKSKGKVKRCQIERVFPLSPYIFHELLTLSFTIKREKKNIRNEIKSKTKSVSEETEEKRKKEKERRF